MSAENRPLKIGKPIPHVVTLRDEAFIEAPGTHITFENDSIPMLINGVLVKPGYVARCSKNWSDKKWTIEVVPK